MDTQSDDCAGAAGAPETDPDLALLERNGIKRVAAYQYWIDGYRYSNLADAVAQAERTLRGAGG